MLDPAQASGLPEHVQSGFGACIGMVMRLTDDQISTIRRETAAVFDDTAVLRLFGSRVNDDARGGDIDIHIEARGTHELLLERELRLKVRLMRLLGDRRIDVVTHPEGELLRPIDAQAHQTGIVL